MASDSLHDAGHVGDEGPAGDYSLAVEKLTKTFSAAQTLYRDLDVRIQTGEIVVVVGESGIGKSVLLKHLIGLIDPTAGKVWYRRISAVGSPPDDLPIHIIPEERMARLRLEIGMVFQESSLFDWMTVAENIGLPLEQHHERVLGLFDGFAARPGMFLRLLDAPAAPPTPYREVREKLAPLRQRLKESLGSLAAAAAGTAIIRDIALAMGVDRARELGAAPEAGSDAAGAGDALRRWLGRPAVRGRLLEAIPDDLLTPSSRQFRQSIRDRRASLFKAYQALRSRWLAPFRDLEELLLLWSLGRKGGEPLAAGTPYAKLVAMADSIGATRDDGHRLSAGEWAARTWLDAMRPVVPEDRGEMPIHLVLRWLKLEPEALFTMIREVYRSPESVPATWRAFADEGRAILAAIEATPAGVDEAELDRERVLAWLTSHPLAVDRAGGAPALVAAVLESLKDRSHEVGAVLSDLPAGSWAPEVEKLRGLQAELSTALSDELGGMRRRVPTGDLIRETIELVVHGLMETFRLVVDRDKDKLPSQLSGGMKTRVGMARSLALLPRIVLYDEPTAGLDPVLAKSIAREILMLQTQGIVDTSIVITHDKDLYRILKGGGRTRLVYLSNGRLHDCTGHPIQEQLRLEEAPVAAPDSDVGEKGRRFVAEFESHSM